MSKLHIEIRDGIKLTVAIEAVRQVVADGKIAEGENGKMYYCFATSFDTSDGDIVVAVRQYRKSDCFVVYRERK